MVLLRPSLDGNKTSLVNRGPRKSSEGPFFDDRHMVNRCLRPKNHISKAFKFKRFPGLRDVELREFTITLVAPGNPVKEEEQKVRQNFWGIVQDQLEFSCLDLKMTILSFLHIFTAS